MDKIDIMQHNLKLIRTMLRFGSSEFGESIGVTKQTISHIECGRQKLSKAQYLAILYVFEHDIFPNLSQETISMIEKMLEMKIAPECIAKNETES